MLCLVSRVKKIGFSVLRIVFLKSSYINWVKFSLFLLLLPIVLLLSRLENSRALVGWRLIFKIKISGIVISLKF